MNPSPQSPSSEWQRTAVAVLAVVFTFNLFGRGIGETYTVFLLPLENEFGWSRSQLTSVYAVYMLVTGLGAPAVGTLFDRFGPRAVYTAGLGFLAAALASASLIGALWQFYLAIGLLVGIGAALVGMVPASGILSRWYRRRLSTAIGVTFAALGCGALVFVPTVQLLVNWLDWRKAYLALGVLLALAALVSALALPWGTYAEGRAEYRMGERDRIAGEGWTLRAAARTPTYWGLGLIFFFTAGGMFTILPQSVAYFIDSGFSPIVAAMAYGLTGMLSVASVSGAGLVAERMGYRSTVTASFAGTGLGILILIAMSFHAAGWLLAVYVVVFGLCQGVRGPIVSSICTTRFAGRRIGTIYGTIYAMNALGAGFGSFMGGVLHDATGGYRAVFLFALGMIAVASTPMWVVRELREFR